MSSLKCRPVALFLLVVFLAGCYTWRPTTVSPPELIEEEAPEQVRVTQWNGEQVTISNPKVQADSIVGAEAGIALEDVRGIEVRRLDGAKTFFVGTIVAVVVVIVYVAISWEPWSPLERLPPPQVDGRGL